MLSVFFPKEVNFFDLFDKQAEFALSAAKYFKEVVSKDGVDADILQKMRDIEHQGDDIAHEIMERLNKTFITPFDREDIHSLAKELDDIIDMIYTITNRLKVYAVHGVDRNLVEFASVIEKSVDGVLCAVKGLRSLKHSRKVLEACIEVNRLENVGDAMRDKMLTELFDRAKDDPVLAIKWKDIYQDAETILDICEDVAHVVEAILVKNA